LRTTAAEGRVGDLEPAAAAGDQEDRVGLSREAIAADNVTGIAESM